MTKTGFYVLELRPVTKHFSGISEVDNVSFFAKPGEVTDYLEPSGSGLLLLSKLLSFVRS